MHMHSFSILRKLGFPSAHIFYDGVPKLASDSADLPWNPNTLLSSTSLRERSAYSIEQGL